MTESSRRGAGDQPLDADEPVQPLAVSTEKVILWGLAVWVVALVLTLAVPGLHAGDRHWWPWTCVAGLALGLFGYSYVRRGRGNATTAG